ncbi:MAG: hypothetical protein ACXQT0_00410 [Candidatus Methanofastidiosia archaeon]
MTHQLCETIHGKYVDIGGIIGSIQFLHEKWQQYWFDGYTVLQ